MARNLILGALVAATAFGCATTPNSSADSHTTGTAVKTAAAADTHCVKDTGSRIKKTDEKTCNAQPGSAYSQEELENTGRIDTGEALKQLDPRIQ